MTTREEFDGVLGGYCRKCVSRHECSSPCELMLKALTYADQQDEAVRQALELQQGTLDLYGVAEAECRALKDRVADLEHELADRGWLREKDDYEHGIATLKAEVARLTERVRELEAERNISNAVIREFGTITPCSICPARKYCDTPDGNAGCRNTIRAYAESQVKGDSNGQAD